MVGVGGLNIYGGGGINFGIGLGNLLMLVGMIVIIIMGGIGSMVVQMVFLNVNVGQFNGGNFGVFNKVSGLGVILLVLGLDGFVNVLFILNLIMFDNEEVKILIGQNVLIIMGLYVQMGMFVLVMLFQMFDCKDVGIMLCVKLQIIDGGLVKMQIFQELLVVVLGMQNVMQGLIINVCLIEINVLVNDGQVVVLGGLFEDNYQDGE